jgi:hypothetical protein
MKSTRALLASVPLLCSVLMFAQSNPVPFVNRVDLFTGPWPMEHRQATGSCC